MGKLLVIGSGKGGVGKSTVAVGLAVSLNNSGKKVLLIDADEGLRCLDLMLSVTEKLIFDLSDVLNDDALTDSAIYSVSGTDGLYLLPAPTAEGMIDKQKAAERISLFTEIYDYVIVDCSAGYNEELCESFKSDTEFLLVANTDAVSVRDVYYVGQMLTGHGFKNLSMVINCFQKNEVGKFKVNIDNIIDETYIKLLGIVPFDKSVKEASFKGKPIRYGKAAMAFQRIAARVDGADVPLPKIKNI